jgi:MFS family permease
MNEDNNAYTIVSLVFFISYTIFQAPAVVFIRKLGPRNFLAAIVLAWGAVMIVSREPRFRQALVLTLEQGFGFVPSWEVMCVLRVILGALEAGCK